MEANVKAALDKIRERYTGRNLDENTTWIIDVMIAAFIELQTPVAGKEALTLGMRFESIGIWHSQIAEAVKVCDAFYGPTIVQANKEGIAEGKRLAIAEMKERFDSITTSTDEWIGIRPSYIKNKIFGQDK